MKPFGNKNILNRMHNTWDIFYLNEGEEASQNNLFAGKNMC